MVNEKRVKTDDAYHFYHNTTLYYSRVDQFFIKFTLQNRKEKVNMKIEYGLYKLIKNETSMVDVSFF
jgi:hypothetical protein